ncbi:hypothetical protein [Thalassospira lucentensis]|uniref:hypothetical protein n=1 Tax=Thalassospira lucentensis TaxID=168935 RepID=UPI0003B6A675|nr:hypothetical protein [Thalassospira lucentensis]RCK23378.1 hypothetical protein TH1_16055 [Thalassospira lucentensis MCCC 1A00383 = DSM 14000]
MKLNQFWNPVLLTTILGCMALSGCQTTRSNHFSEWKETPIASARFNIMQALSVPVSAVQQRSRNNGQVLDEKWVLACGKGEVQIQHVSSAWFNPSTISDLKSEETFAAQVIAGAGSNVSLQNTTSVTIPTGRRIGYYADVKKSNGDICQGAIFGIRGKNARMYDNDRGQVDTYIELHYCGDERIDMGTFVETVDMTKNGAANAGQLQDCTSAYSEPKLTETLDTQKKANATVVWDGTYKGSGPIEISHGPTTGVFNVSFDEGLTCEGHFKASDPQKPLNADWSMKCNNGQSAKGFFYPENDKLLYGKGTDQKGSNILLQIEL